MLKALDVDPRNFRVLEQYVYQEAVFGDRRKAIQRLSQFLDAVQGNPELTARALSLLLPHAEAEARIQAGLNYYSSENLDESPFIYSKFELDAYRRATMDWVSYGSEAQCRIDWASIAFVDGDYKTTDSRLDPVRGQATTQLSAVHFTGKWFDDLDVVLEQFVAALPTVRHVVTEDDCPGFYNLDANLHGTRRVFIGCDPGYFHQYGIVLAHSLKQTPCQPHFHIFDSDGTVEAAVLREILPRFTLTCERVNMGEPANAKFYYAPVRLIRMAQLMGDSGPVVMLDADVMCGQSLKPLFDRLESHDAILCRMPGRVPYHTQINASVVGIAPGGQKYLRRVAGYIAKCFRENCVPWCLDQIALNCTLRRWRDDVDAVACGPLVYDGGFDAMICPQKIDERSPELARWREMRGKFLQ